MVQGEFFPNKAVAGVLFPEVQASKLVFEELQKSLSKEELAYLAGIIDGEGCMTIVHTNRGKRNPAGYWAARLCVQMTDRGPIDKLALAFGGSIYISPPNKWHKRTSFSWVAAGRKAHVACRLILPYLIVKREQAKLLIKMQESRRDTRMGSFGSRKLTGCEIAERWKLQHQVRALNHGRGKDRAEWAI